MAEQEVDEEPEATAAGEEEPDAAAAGEEEPTAEAGEEEPDAAAAEDADSDEAGMADAVDSRAEEMTGGGGGGGGADDQPISEINRGAVDAAAEHLDDANLDSDRETLKKIQKDM